MSKQCRFCGGKISSDAYECEHCGKTLRKRAESETTGLTNIDSWKKKSVPAWVMYLVCGFFLFCLILLFVQAGDQDEEKKNGDETSQTEGNPDSKQ